MTAVALLVAVKTLSSPIKPFSDAVGAIEARENMPPGPWIKV